MAERSTASVPPVLEARGLDVGYDGFAVVRGLSFAIRPGETVALLGGSGCGKSTVMRTLVGLLPPIAGSVRLLGRELASADEPEKPGREELLRRVGVMFQGGALFGAQNLLENVMFPLLEFTQCPREVAERTARMKLAEVGLGAYTRHYPNEISGGMLKRAAIARAMALDPAVLFLDEPSAGLDPVTSASLDELLLRIRSERGTAIVLVSHELASVFRVADRALFLDRETHSLLDSGPPAELRDSSPHDKIRAFFRREPEVTP